MSLREQARAANPGFPWLSDDDAQAVSALMERNRWLLPGEAVTGVRRAGEGNMNLTLRVDTSARTVVLKQARPWVEKYDSIAAPWERSDFEQRFYERVRGVDRVAARMPRLLGADARSHALLFEFVEGARDLSSVYQGERLMPDDLDALARWLAALHQGVRGPVDPAFSNLEMRKLNHEHIYRLPIAGVPGFDLEQFEPGLAAAADQLRADGAFTELVSRTGARYLASGNCLLHGDFFPGSWLKSDAGVKVIDPEFCFWGDPEFDLACAMAHLVLSGHERSAWDTFGNSYRAANSLEVDSALMTRFAGIEVVRRLIGVAQLPIPPSSDGRRARWLERARRAVVSGSVSNLWT